MNIPEGFRRLGHFLGVLSAVALFLYMLGSAAGRGFLWDDLLFVVVLPGLAYLVVRGLFEAVGWVVDGFMQPRDSD